MPHYVGIDIGGTKTAAGLVSSDGRVVQREERPTPAEEGGSRVLAAAIDLATGFVQSSGVAAIGIGAGGQIDSTQGVVVSATDLLPGWAGTDLRSAFAGTFGVPVFVDNDVNAHCLGECMFGVARGFSTVVFLALGTGVGGALILDGRIHHGAHWSGGEFGHILLSASNDARVDLGGASGTLEAYASGPGLITTWRELTGRTDAGVTGRDIAAEAAADPESYAARAITRTGEYLGFGLVSLANAIDPDIIVIGGGLCALGASLIDPAVAILKRHALPGPSRCRVVAASLGPDAGVVGAACLAMSGIGKSAP